MDLDSVYDNLQDYNLGESLFRLQEENKRLSSLVVSLQDDVKKLCDNVTEMKKTQDNLAKNISELYKTAKAEITRKDRVIADLRSELDDHVFRRNKGSLPNKTQPVNLGIIHENIKDSKGVLSTESHSYDKLDSRDGGLSRNRGDYTERVHRDHLPVLEDVDLCLPDDRRYAQGKKRQLEERPGDRIDNKRTKFQHEDYNRSNRYDRRHRSRDGRYDERRFHDARRIKEDRRFTDSFKFNDDYRSDNQLDSYSDRRFRRHDDDRRSSEESQCLNKYTELRESGRTIRKSSHERKLETKEALKYTEKADRRALYKISENSTKSESHQRKTENREQGFAKEETLTKSQASIVKVEVIEVSKPASDKRDVIFDKGKYIGGKGSKVQENASQDKRIHVSLLDVGNTYDNATLNRCPDQIVYKSNTCNAVSDNNVSNDVSPLALNNAYHTQQHDSHYISNNFSSELVENNVASNTVQLDAAELNKVKCNSSDSSITACATTNGAKNQFKNATTNDAKNLVKNKKSKSKKAKDNVVNIKTAEESLKPLYDNILDDLAYHTQQNDSHYIHNNFSSELVESYVPPNTVQLDAAELHNVKCNSSDSSMTACATTSDAKNLLKKATTNAKNLLKNATTYDAMSLLKNKKSKSKKAKVDIKTAEESLKPLFDNILDDLAYHTQQNDSHYIRNNFSLELAENNVPLNTVQLDAAELNKVKRNSSDSLMTPCATSKDPKNLLKNATTNDEKNLLKNVTTNDAKSLLKNKKSKSKKAKDNVVNIKTAEESVKPLYDNKLDDLAFICDGTKPSAKVSSSNSVLSNPTCILSTYVEKSASDSKLLINKSKDKASESDKMYDVNPVSDMASHIENVGSSNSVLSNSTGILSTCAERSVSDCKSLINKPKDKASESDKMYDTSSVNPVHDMTSHIEKLSSSNSVWSNPTGIPPSCVERSVSDSKSLIDKSKDNASESDRTYDTSSVNPVSDITSHVTNADTVIDTVTDQMLNASNISEVSNSSSHNVSVHRKKRRRCIISIQN